MNPESVERKDENQGYIIIKVSTARGAIPLEDAAVSIRGASAENSGIIYSLRTTSDGLTKKVSLPAPNISLSESPGNPFPFSTWNIDVFKEGYIPAYFQNVPVYSSITSVQPAILIPFSENAKFSERINESQTPSL